MARRMGGGSMTRTRSFFFGNCTPSQTPPHYDSSWPTIPAGHMIYDSVYPSFRSAQKKPADVVERLYTPRCHPTETTIKKKRKREAERKVNSRDTCSRSRNPSTSGKVLASSALCVASHRICSFFCVRLDDVVEFFTELSCDVAKRSSYSYSRYYIAHHQQSSFRGSASCPCLERRPEVVERLRVMPVACSSITTPLTLSSFFPFSLSLLVEYHGYLRVPSQQLQGGTCQDFFGMGNPRTEDWGGNEGVASALAKLA
ncbi:hypothetical protein B0F90DRAFT_1730972 [Multifurca ochricompacta]|uniref:Uncharacterized protein n=1 Tax=Multifurca ochricompacta TaxID=376703 RepID=A0AAD4M2E5_9AGAM|nr:hypothetical protein B0F90DRAFT_1730972 [Multifurca ochricompacta]